MVDVISTVAQFGASIASRLRVHSASELLRGSAPSDYKKRQEGRVIAALSSSDQLSTRIGVEAYENPPASYTMAQAFLSISGNMLTTLDKLEINQHLRTIISLVITILGRTVEMPEILEKVHFSINTMGIDTMDVAQLLLLLVSLMGQVKAHVKAKDIELGVIAENSR